MERSRTDHSLPAGPFIRFRAAAAAAAVAGAALAASCGSSPQADPMAQGKVVLGGGDGASGARPASDGVADGERALAAAEDAWRSGDALTAVAVANQALRRGVPPDVEAKLRELRARARASVVADRVVAIRALPSKDVVGDGDAVPVRIVLRNAASAELRSPVRESGSSDAQFVLRVTREDHDVYGNVRSSDFTIRTPLPADLAIPPGGEREVEVTIGAEVATLGHEGFSVLRIGGTFRPVALRVGESEFFDAIPVEPASVRVLQKGWEPLASDPATALRRAVAKRSPPHVIAAAELLAPSERAAARVLLRDAIDRDPPLAFCLKAALARLDELDAPTSGGSPR